MSGECSEVGPVRAANEDCVRLDGEVGLFVVADGMGGHQAGEIASHLAVAPVAAEVRDGASDTWPDPGSAENLPATLLRSALQAANARVYTSGAGDPALPAWARPSPPC